MESFVDFESTDPDRIITSNTSQTAREVSRSPDVHGPVSEIAGDGVRCTSNNEEACRALPFAKRDRLEYKKDEISPPWILARRAEGIRIRDQMQLQHEIKIYWDYYHFKHRMSNREAERGMLGSLRASGWYQPTASGL